MIRKRKSKKKRKFKIVYASHITVDHSLTDRRGKSVRREYGNLMGLNVKVGSLWGKVLRRCSSWGKR